jgi:hypothetical protein
MMFFALGTAHSAPLLFVSTAIMLPEPEVLFHQHFVALGARTGFSCQPPFRHCF